MLREELEADQEERLVAQEAALREVAEEEKRDVLIRVESEKNLLKQKLHEERANLKQRYSQLVLTLHGPTLTLCSLF